MSEQIREPLPLESAPDAGTAAKEAAEAAAKAEALRWVRKNRISIGRLLKRTDGDVVTKTSERVQRTNGLDHQWVKIGSQFPHEVRSTTGGRVLATLAEADAQVPREEAAEAA